MARSPDYGRNARRAAGEPGNRRRGPHRSPATYRLTYGSLRGRIRGCAARRATSIAAIATSSSRARTTARTRATSACCGRSEEGARAATLHGTWLARGRLRRSDKMLRQRVRPRNRTAECCTGHGRLLDSHRHPGRHPAMPLRSLSKTAGVHREPVLLRQSRLNSKLASVFLLLPMYNASRP